MLKKRLAAYFFISLLLLPAWPAQAVDINLNHLISDSELTAYNSLTQTDIKNFLLAKGSVLRHMFFTLDDGRQLSAAEIIYNAAQANQINPKFLLALIEKEQSLVTSEDRTQRAIDFAAGYGCFTGEVCQDRWKGFPKQINSASIQFRYYIEHIDEYQFQPGKTSKICNDYDGRCEYVTPLNVSTAALYVYTPHIHGNELFKKIWDAFFAFAKYPD